MNGLLDAADAVVANSPGIYAAQQLLLEDRQNLRCFLARIETATLIQTNRMWSYSGRAWNIDTSYGSPGTFVNDSRDQFTGAINLRELFNYDNPIDGMDPTDPAVTVGPVGSTNAGNTWSTGNLKAVVVMYATVKANGSPVWFFDRPNPVRCQVTEFNYGE